MTGVQTCALPICSGSLAEAQRLTLGVAQEQGNINFALLPVKTVRVSGLALTTGGERLAGGVVTLNPSGDSASAFGIGGNTTRVRNDGTFTLTNVVPGAYTLNAATGGGGGRRGATGDAEFASMPLSVGSDDLNGITIVTGRGATLTGTVVTAEGTTGELRTTGLQVVEQAIRTELGGPFGGNNNARVRTLALMKPSATLINMGRGGLVDEAALAHALQSGEIAMAALDVYQREPLPANSPLLKLPNVVLTPHLGGGSYRSWEMDMPASLANIQNYFAGT